MPKKREVARDVNAGVRAAKALQLRTLGLTYEAVAQQCGYRDRGGAHHAVQRELRRMIQEPADEVRQIEIERLDALLRAMLPKALKGDGWSVDRVLRIMERRAGLLGLDARPDQQTITAQILIRRYDANTEAV